MLLALGIVLDQDVVEQEAITTKPTRAVTADYCYTYDQTSSCRPTVYTPYKRINHFTQRLYQITASLVTPIPPRLLHYIRQRLVDKPLDDPYIYFTIRALLKGLREPMYYNLIFAIIRQLGGPKVTVDYDEHRKILKQYAQLSKRWDLGVRELSGRRYFPSYYLIVAVLLDANDIHVPFHLPSVKDANKLTRLRHLANQLML